MFVKQNKSHKGILLTFTVGYRENGKVKHKNIETIGYLYDLKNSMMFLFHILNKLLSNVLIMKLMN